jgi:hypothetical protein
MWTDWHPDEIATDLDRVVSLHANTAPVWSDDVSFSR